MDEIGNDPGGGGCHHNIDGPFHEKLSEIVEHPQPQLCPPRTTVQSETTSSARQLYAALPLPAKDCNSIRLLDLEPPKRNWTGAIVNAPLAGRLRIACLRDAPSFTALSYVWGQKAVPSHTIACSLSEACGMRPDSLDGPVHQSDQTVHLEITASCHAALQQIRTKFRPVTIWVDSICINQEDDDEKATQIPLMRDIFTWARTVYIWLGDGTRQSDRAMDYLHHCGMAMGRLPVSWLAATGDGERNRERVRFRNANLWDPLRRLYFLFRPKNWVVTPRDIQELLNRDWMRRLWTFQEVILSPNPVVLCGDRVLTWGRLLNAIYCTSENLNLFCLFRPWIWWGVGSVGVLSHDTAMGRWRSLADLWLKYPRESRWNGVLVRSNPRAKMASGPDEVEDREDPAPPSPSFVETFRRLNLRQDLRRRLRIPLVTFDSVLVLSWLAFWGYMTYLVGIELNKRIGGRVKGEDESEDAFDTGIVFLWILGVLGWLLASLYSLYIPMSIQSLFIFVVLGLPHVKFLSEREDSNHEATLRQILGGMQGALRSRRSERRHDKSFALDGILSTFDTATSQPNYQQPYGETFRLLMERMVKWQPSAIAMIVDAGAISPPGGPSWVPRWGSSASPWLSIRYVVGSAACSIPSSGTSRGIPPIIVGKQLKLQALSFGMVRLRVAFKPPQQTPPTEASEDDEDIKAVLIFLNDFIDCCTRRAHYDFPTSCAYAVTKGLAPRRGPTHETKWEGGSHEFSEGREVKVPLPLWKGPYDFSDQKKDFKIFARMYDMVRRIRRPVVGIGPSTRATAEVGMEVDGAMEIVTGNPTRSGTGTEGAADSGTMEPIHDIGRTCVSLGAIAGSRVLLTKLARQVASERRCLFSLSSGRIGTGPPGMQPGDDVFLLQGVPIPMVLRRTKEQGVYTTIGAVLVHGLMYGESAGLMEPTTITLV